MTDASTAAPTGGAPTTTPDGQQVATPPAPAPNAGETTLDAAGIAALQAENARLAKEAADARVKAKGAVAEGAKRDQLLAFAKAIGIELPETDDKSPEALQAKLQQELQGRQTDQTALQQERRDAAVQIAALTEGIPAEKQQYLGFLLNSNEAFTKLDSSSADYKASVAALVKTIATADPFFATAAPGGTGRSGAEVHGGAGNAGEVTQAAFDAMGVMEKSALYTKNPELYNRLAGTSS